ncbi:MAG: hypothetical protein AAF798_01730 [Bacteroidota bacterium]
MSIFDFLFGKSTAALPQPDIRFGRYSDSYKEASNYKSWDIALEKFEEEQYLECYKQFFRYLRDEHEDNVRCWSDNGGIRFELFQGSNKIVGFANEHQLRAEAKVVKTSSLRVGFMRRMLEQNFELKYSRFSMDEDNTISIVFDTYSLDGSPYKLYYALKEVATRADKQDDLLLEEFKSLEPADIGHLEQLKTEEKEAKYQFIVTQIQKVLREIEEGELNKDQYPGGIAYLLLHLIFKLDYLVKPEGLTMETLERIHRKYYDNDGRSVVEKNQMLCKELKQMAERDKVSFFNEMYLTKCTFGITIPVNHDRVVGFIDSDLPNMDWYQENGYPCIAQAIPSYIVGYCMFNYAIPKPDRELFHLYFQITESAYFKDLGFQLDYYNEETKALNKRAIRRAIDQIAEKNSQRFPRLDPALGSLEFDNMLNFSRSFLRLVRNLDMTKSE